jgi:hypothetical protein
MTDVRPHFVAEIPKGAGKLLGVAIWQGKLLLACEHGVYELTEAAYPEPRKIREVIALNHEGESDG